MSIIKLLIKPTVSLRILEPFLHRGEATDGPEARAAEGLLGHAIRPTCSPTPRWISLIAAAGSFPAGWRTRTESADPEFILTVNQ